MSVTLRIGRRRGLLSIEELHEDPAGLSLASRSGPKCCVYRLLALCRLAVEWRAKGETGEVQRLLRCLQAIRVGTLKIAGQDVSGAQFVVRRSSESRKCTNSASTSHVFASRWVEHSVSDCASFQSPSIYQGELLDRLKSRIGQELMLRTLWKYGESRHGASRDAYRREHNFWIDSTVTATGFEGDLFNLTARKA
jgi:hypothetical protein